MMKSKELDKLRQTLIDDVLGIMNEKVIIPHREKKVMTSAEAIYVASSAMAACSAIILAQNLPNGDKLEQLLKSFHKLFSEEARDLVKMKGAAKQQPSASAWGITQLKWEGGDKE